MRDLLSGYYAPTDQEFQKLWNEGLFVFDTSVLLNLYRYPSSARNEFFQLIDHVKDRIFMPFHVALEYQRNRLTVISEQKKKFSETRNAAQKAMTNMEAEFSSLQIKDRHSIINTDSLTHEVSSAIKKFNEELEKLERNQVDVHDHDAVREKIDSLFSGSIGVPPKKEFIEQICKEGAERHAIKMPPGFADEKKGESSGSTFSYGGITYQTKFGDLIVWKQIIDKSKSLAGKPIIFITDDRKDDWWLIVDSQGKKQIGPRPELVEEISREGSADLFYMYNSAGFLKHAKDNIRADISESSIDQVKEISSKTDDAEIIAPSPNINARKIIESWALSAHIIETVELSPSFCDIFGTDSSKQKIGIEIVKQVPTQGTMPKIDSILGLIQPEIKDGIIDRIELVVILYQRKIGSKLLSGIEKILRSTNGDMTFTLGTINRTTSGIHFIPMKRMTHLE